MAEVAEKGKGKYQAYPEYKDSGVEWLREVPSEWNVMQLRRITHLQQGLQIPQDKRFHEPGKDRVEYITIKYLNAKDSSQAEYILSASDRVLCDEDDILLARTGATGQVVTGVEGAFHNNFFKVNYDKQKVNKEFLVYFLSVKEVLGHLLMLAGTTTIPDLNHGAFLGTKIALPNFIEQQEVINFLDHETAKIDTLIDKQQQLIKLLKEKRQAVISNAVTKGLNPDVPMRDSGVEWLGEVPEHWDIVPIKHVAGIRYGIGEPPKYQDEGTPLIRATNIRSGKISDVGLVKVNPNDIPEKRIVWLKSGDIIIVRSGAGTGDSSIISKEYEGSIAGFDMVVRPIRCVAAFLAHVLLSNYVRNNQIDIEKTRAAQPHLNAEELGDCFILLPPNEEQQLMVDYIDRKTLRLDFLAEKAEEAALLLIERRTALISAAVTGKIDVRNWVAPKSSSPEEHGNKDVA